MGEFDAQSGLLVCIADLVGLSIFAPTLPPSTARERLATMPARLAAD